jgi:hypothetical protein
MARVPDAPRARLTGAHDPTAPRRPARAYRQRAPVRGDPDHHGDPYGDPRQIWKTVNNRETSQLGITYRGGPLARKPNPAQPRCGPATALRTPSALIPTAARHPAVRPVPWAPTDCLRVRRHRPANRQCANPTARQRGVHLGDRRPGPRCAQGQGQHHTRCVWRYRANHIPDPSGRLGGRDRHDRRRRHRARHVPASARRARGCRR